MVVHRKQKSERARGSKTHFGGAKKKRRGAGHRGGRGMAGSGKRADQKKTMIWKDTKYFGKFGFKKKNIKVIFSSIGIKEIEDRLPTLVADNKVKKDGAFYVINLEDIGYNKLLSNGTPVNKWKITVPYASANAVDRIKEAGGEILGLEEKQKAPAKQEKPKKAE